MARVQVVSDDGSAVVEISTDDEGRSTATCSVHGEVDNDRGWVFEDTVRAAELHVDQRH